MLVAEVATYLASQGLGTFDTTGTSGTIFVEVLPESPDECVAVYSRAGSGSDSGLPYDYPNVQVLVRGTQDPRGAESVAKSIYDALHGLRNISLTVGGTWLVGCKGIQSGPVHIGRDDNGRHEYSLNFALIVKNSGRA